jgi:lysophospholipase L1-like esterase
MIPLATGLFSVLRGTGENEFGDPTDAGTVVLTGVPLALGPISRAATSRADGQLREVDTYAGWAPYGTELELEDRVVNETTGETFVLATLSRPRGAILQQDIRIEARRVAGAVLPVPLYTVPDELAVVAAALDGVLATPPLGRVNIVVVGDSNGEGQGAVVEPKRWVAVLQDRLRAAADLTGPAVPFLPPAYGGTTLTPLPSAIDTSSASATTTADVRYGMGGRARQYAKGAFSTWTALCTSFRVHYAKDSFGVNANVTVDGVAQAAFSCNGTAAGGFVAAYGPYAEAQHTIKVQVSDLTLGFIITLEGLEFFLGDENVGIGVYDASRFGTLTDTFGTEHAKAVGSVNPTCMIYAHGINDTLVYTAAQSGTKLAAEIATNSAQITSPHSKIVLIHPGRDGVGLEPYANYVAAWTSAAASAGAHVINLADVMGAAGTADGAPYFADTVHYDQDGHELVGETIAAELLRRT